MELSEYLFFNGVTRLLNPEQEFEQGIINHYLEHGFLSVKQLQSLAKLSYSYNIAEIARLKTLPINSYVAGIAQRTTGILPTSTPIITMTSTWTPIELNVLIQAIDVVKDSKLTLDELIAELPNKDLGKLKNKLSSIGLGYTHTGLIYINEKSGKLSNFLSKHGASHGS